MKRRWLPLVLAAILSPVALAGGLTKEDLAKALAAHPEVVLDFMRDHRKELFDILNNALAEDEEQQRVKDAAAAKKELDEAFANPKVPLIDASTRIRGNRSARYTLVEYSDFQCPFCARASHTVEELRKKYGEDLRFIYKNEPLVNAHPQALVAAFYFEAASLQSHEKAWEFHDRLYQNQDKLSEDFYKATARELGLDGERLEKDAHGPQVKQRIDDDAAEASRFGFTGTPGFILNGVPIHGAFPIDYFDSIINRLAGQPQSKSGSSGTKGR
jgi:protein-disulfide isomerase